MNLFLVFAFLFSTGSLMGWVIELFFRRFMSVENKNHVWVNPGFLVGPYLPLYGFALCVLFIMAWINIPFIENEIIKKLVLFLVMAFAMTVIEYITGYIFIITLKVRLWDYSDNWGNIKGIICPQFSFYWALLGAMYYFVIHPHILSALNWLSHNLAFSFGIGFFYGIFAIDIVYSFNIVTKIRTFAKENELVVKYELLRQQIKEYTENSKKKAKFFLRFNSDISFEEHLTRYFELRATFDKNTVTRMKDKIRRKRKN